MTPREAVATVTRLVRSLEAQGADRDSAIRIVSAKLGVEQHKVRWFVDQDSRSPAPVAASRRHRGSPGCGERTAAAAVASA